MKIFTVPVSGIAAASPANESSEDSGDSVNVFTSLKSMLTAPVAGARKFRIGYLCVLWLAVALFLYTVFAAIPEWQQPVSIVSTEYRSELVFPDLVVCTPADVRAVAVSVTPPGDISVVSQDAIGTSSCPMIFSPLLAPVSSTLCAADLQSSSVSAAAMEIESLLPTVTVGGNVIKASCSMFKMKSTTVATALNRASLLLIKIRFSPPFPSYFSVFAFPAGASPVSTVDGVRTITSNQMLIGGAGMESLVELEVEETQDQTKGEKDFTPRFLQSGGAQSLSSMNLVKSFNNLAFQLVDSVTSNVVVRFSTLTVRRILIRRVTFSEVWGQIGGLWGGAVGVVSIFFTLSGHLNDSNEEVYVFRWLLPKVRRQQLSSLRAKDDNEFVTQGRIAALEKQLQQLLPKAVPTTGAGPPC